MGLDISYYSNVEHIPPNKVPKGVKPFNKEFDEWDKQYPNHYLYYIDKKNTNWPKHLEGLENGWYLVPRTLGTNSFRAGSYSGYNEWRDDLALAAGFSGGAQEVWSLEDESIIGKPESPPFSELINFSDSDGIIGPKLSKKLYNDFINNEGKIKENIDMWFLKVHPYKEYDIRDMEWFFAKYDDWKEAFKVASENGFVSFH